MKGFQNVPVYLTGEGIFAALFLDKSGGICYHIRQKNQYEILGFERNET